MTDIENGLRALIMDAVRAELRAERAEQAKPDEWLSTETAAKLADVAPATIRRWVRLGTLTRHSAGRVLRVSRVELDRWIRNGIAANQPDAELTPEQLAIKHHG